MTRWDRKLQFDTPVSAAICLPVQRAGAAARPPQPPPGASAAAADARDDRSSKPAKPSRRYRSTHLQTVRGQMPTASATASGVCPLATCRNFTSSFHVIGEIFEASTKVQAWGRRR